jgi:hypothetical protein
MHAHWRGFVFGKFTCWRVFKFLVGVLSSFPWSHTRSYHYHDLYLYHYHHHYIPCETTKINV